MTQRIFWTFLNDTFEGFFASGMKRAFGLKDFGDYFPGHGGVFDRMDCQLLMHIAVYVHYATFVKGVSLGLPHIQAAISALPLSQQQELLEWLQDKIA